MNIQRRRSVHAEPYAEGANLLLRLFAEKSTRQEYLDAVVERIQQWSECRCVGIRVLNERDEIPYESYVGFTHEFWASENWISVQEDNCVCIRVVRGRPEPQDRAVLTPGGAFRCDDSFQFISAMTPQESARYRGVCIASGFASIAVVPIRHQERIVGAIHLADERRNRVPLPLVEFIESTGPLVGEALHRFDLEDELHRNYDTQRVINSLLRLSLRNLSVEVILSEFLKLVFSIPWLNFERKGAVFLAEGDTNALSLRAKKGLSRRVLQECNQVPFGRCLCGRAASEGEILFAESIDDRHENCCEGVAQHGHYCVPVKAGKKVIGVLNVYLKAGHRRLEREKDFLTSITDTLASILERKRTEEALGRSEAKYSTLVENSLTGIFLIQDGVIRFANRKFAHMFGYPNSRLLGLEADLLVHPEERAFANEVRRKKLAGEEAPSEYEIRGLRRDGQTIWLQRISALTEYAGRPAILGNVIDITQRKKMEESLRKSEMELRFLSSQLIGAQEDERRRIALELHDTIAQDLISIKLRLGQRLGEGGKDASDDPIIDMIGKSIEELRRIMADLRPSVLDDLGILATIRYHCREFMKIHEGIRVDASWSIAEEDIPGPLKVVIFRVLQEALNNVGKHSQACNVKVSIDRVRSRIHLLVQDDGTGFDLEKTLSRKDAQKGIGLYSMRERIDLSGGTFSIHSRKGKGTRIAASWPCTRAAS